jgi:hypothetical protein
MQTVDHPTSHRRPGLPRTGGTTPSPRTPVAPAPDGAPCRAGLSYSTKPGSHSSMTLR